MKRLIYFILFTVSFVFVSCNHETTYDYGKYETEKYNTAFIKAFGEPASNQTWGFGSKAITRSAYTNSNMWASDGYVIPKVITQDEVDKVLEVFNQKGKESYVSLVDWDCFFVQHVYKGIASYTAGNGGTVVGGNQMDWLCAYDPVGFDDVVYGLPEYNYQPHHFTNHDDHVNNFNNANGSIMLMVNSSTSRFGYKSSTDNGHVFYYFRMEKINGAYYVGFDFSAEGQNPNEQVQRDLIYNDWIVKIVPGYGSNPPANKLRIMAEDLSASEGTDFDFNDVVFDVNIENGNANCVLLAAGGTLPLRIAGSDDFEVHKLFDVAVKVMVNTRAGHHHDYEYVPFTINNISDAADIKLEVFKNNTWIEMTAKQGVPAAKIAVPQSVDWCDERQGIDFGNWVQDVNYIWW